MVKSYLSNPCPPRPHSPLIISAESGSGKTALMAVIASRVSKITLEPKDKGYSKMI